MASPAILEIDPLLLPLEGEETAAGKPVPWTVKEQLEEARKEIDPSLWDTIDPQRPGEPKYADWKTVIQLCQKTLRETSKDLQLAVDLLEALTRFHGAAGLRDGLRLVRRFSEDCWDRMFPMVEDGDVEFWQEKVLGIFESLDVPSKRMDFPETVRQLPLVLVRDPFSKEIVKKITWREWNKMGSGNNPDAAQQKEEFEKAVMAMAPEDIQTMKGDLDEALEEITQLMNFLNGKFQANAPSFSGLRGAVTDVKKQVDHLAGRKAGNAPVEAAPTESGGAPASAGGGGGMVMAAPNAAASRAEVYRQLAFYSNRLKELEPHSPIPYLVERAVKLGAMPWPELMKNLVRNSEVVTELYREFGIKEETAEGGGEGGGSGW